MHILRPYTTNCVKFHQYWFIRFGGVALTRNMDGQTKVRRTDRYNKSALLSKNGVFHVEMRLLPIGDEKLRSVCVWSIVSHWYYPSNAVLEI